MDYNNDNKWVFGKSSPEAMQHSLLFFHRAVAYCDFATTSEYASCSYSPRRLSSLLQTNNRIEAALSGLCTLFPNRTSPPRFSPHNPRKPQTHAWRFSFALDKHTRARYESILARLQRFFLSTATASQRELSGKIPPKRNKFYGIPALVPRLNSPAPPTPTYVTRLFLS